MCWNTLYFAHTSKMFVNADGSFRENRFGPGEQNHREVRSSHTREMLHV